MLNEDELKFKVFCTLQNAHKFNRSPEETTDKVIDLFRSSLYSNLVLETPNTLSEEGLTALRNKFHDLYIGNGKEYANVPKC